jgi:4-hydroxy-4-methyl-2-oxoglutarate aldolase
MAMSRSWWAGSASRSGDWIVGDQDGLVIVPRERIDEILGEAEGKVATENEIRESVRRGTLPLEAYERFGTL